MTEYTSPTARQVLNGTIAYHTIDDTSREDNQKNALAISIIILIGSTATVSANIAKGGPKAKKVHPKKSMRVILKLF